MLFIRDLLGKLLNHDAIWSYYVFQNTQLYLEFLIQPIRNLKKVNQSIYRQIPNKITQ